MVFHFDTFVTNNPHHLSKKTNVNKKSPVLWVETDASKQSAFWKDYNVIKLGWIILIPLTKSAASVRKHTVSPPPKKLCLTKSVWMIMMVIFFEHKGVIYQHAGASKKYSKWWTLWSSFQSLRQYISRKSHELVIISQ